jgi:hypothetical protein
MGRDAEVRLFQMTGGTEVIGVTLQGGKCQPSAGLDRQLCRVAKEAVVPALRSTLKVFGVMRIVGFVALGRVAREAEEKSGLVAS